MYMVPGRPVIINGKRSDTIKLAHRSPFERSEYQSRSPLDLCAGGLKHWDWGFQSLIYAENYIYAGLAAGTCFSKAGCV